jgi:hypothetical protein
LSRKSIEKKLFHRDAQRKKEITSSVHPSGSSHGVINPNVFALTIVFSPDRSGNKKMLSDLKAFFYCIEEQENGWQECPNLSLLKII